MSSTGTLELVGAVAERDAQRRDLRRQQLDLLCRQSARVSFAIPFAMAFIAYLVWGFVRWEAVVLWLVLLGSLLIARRAYAVRQIDTTRPDPETGLRAMMTFAFLIGAAAGTAATLFFFPLPEVDRALLTMLLVCWTAGGVSTAAAYAPAFYAYVAPALAPLMLCWLASEAAEARIVGFLIVLFALFQVYFVRDNERVLRRSFELRFEKEQLIREKERLIEDLVVARDQAQSANRAKSMLLAFASHDLRQPCLALGLCSSALNLLASTPQMQSIARQLSQAVGVLAQLLDGILDYSQIDAGAVKALRKTVRLDKLVGELEQELAPLAAKAGLAFEAHCPAIVVDTDEVLLARILRNLLHNAFKYTPKGKVVLEASRDAETIRIAVRDTGRGIPAHERERIFDDFYQVPGTLPGRAEGLGLGLSIVMSYARLLGYRVTVDSKPGKGSTFTVEIPLSAHAAGGAAAPSDAEQTLQLSGISALVLEEPGGACDAIRALLESWGCRILMAGGLEHALELAQDGSRTIHVAVLDLDRYRNGAAAAIAEQLRAALARAPAIVVSADADPQKLQSSLAIGLSLVNKTSVH